MTSDTTTTRRARSESGHDPSFPRPSVVCLSFWFCCGAACVVAMHTRDRAHHTPPHTARASSSPASCRRETTTTTTAATRNAPPFNLSAGGVSMGCLLPLVAARGDGGGVAKEPATPSGEAPSPPLPAVTPSPSAGIQDSPLHFGLRSCACQFACLGLGQLACAFMKNHNPVSGERGW